MTTFEERLTSTLSSAYIIERELGGGGMSRVFIATDRILGRKIVIKVLSPELTAEVNRGRFRREIQVAAQLQHPHIVPLLSAGEQDDLLYFTMPFIKGESLKTAIDKDGRMPVADVMRVINHVGEAIAYAHEMGIVHRDIKPANILRSGSYALVTDFGVAKALNAAMPSSGMQGMTQTGMAIGTPAYMAPEQLAGEAAADHRVDIYALGLLAYELLNGKSPFAGVSPQRMLAAVLTQEPTPLTEVRPDVPQSLSDVVMSCLSKEAANRPTSARELLQTLDMFHTSSGEIKTIEHRVPHIVHTPTPNSGTSPIVTRADVTAAEGATNADGSPVTSAEFLSGDVEAVSYSTQKKSRTGLYAGIVAVLFMITIGVFFMSQRGSAGSPETVAPPASPVAMMIDTLPLNPAPLVSPESTVAGPAVPLVDSQALARRDSIRRARRDSIRKDSTRRAVAHADSIRRTEQDVVGKARRAASAMLSNAAAAEAFRKGSTRMGGVLNSKRKGDLQTQIDALQPFLSQAGLSYSQFKEIVRGAGVNLFDEYGRMIPDSLRRFGSGG